MLSFNKHLNTWVLATPDGNRARECGLTRSLTARTRSGQVIWFTADHNGKPVNNPYPVLEFWDEADDDALRRLAPFMRDYDASWAKDSELDIPIPAGFRLDPFQRAGVAFCYARGNCLIGDEPGLGKTVQAIALANLVDARRVLVVCPANVRLHWQAFAKRWSTIPGVCTYPIFSAKNGVHPRCHYIIISYDILRNDSIQKTLASEEWDLVILDEAHFLKTPDAKRTQAVFGAGRYRGGGIVGKAKRTLALTGTPLMNRPRECYTLARGLNWESIDFMSEDYFRNRFNPSGWGWEVQGRLPELRARLRCNFMIRRLKSEVLTDLPDKRYEMTFIEETGAVRAVLAKEKLLHFNPERIFESTFDVDGEMSTVRREMGEAKAPLVVEHIKYLLDIVELPKLVVFAHHRNVLDLLNDALVQYGPVMYRGGMTTSAKEMSRRAFISNPDCKIFLGQTDSAGLGLDGLQEVASHVVFAEPSWTPGTNEQAADRCHRKGQHQSVVVQFLIAEGSIDELVLGVMLRKVGVIHVALDGVKDEEARTQA